MSILKQGMLTGTEIARQVKKGNITISPYDPKCLNPNSYNLKLHPQLLIYSRDSERANIVNNTINSSIPTCIEHIISEIGPINSEISTVVEKDKDLKDANHNVLATISRINKIEKLASDKFNELSSAIDDRYNELHNMIKETHDEINNIPIVGGNHLPPLDMHKKNNTIEFEIPEEGYVLQPGVLYIGRTVEKTGTDKFIPMINGRSSGGRLGISIHICAGFGDIGFEGTWTLEITVVEPVRIYPYEEIAQVCYFTPAGKKPKLYRGRYYNQEAATASRFHQPKKEY